MMVRGRTHHNVTNQKKSEDPSRRSTIEMDCYFMKMKFVVNAQAMPEESVTSIAVKEDIMSSVALNQLREWRHSMTCLVIARSH